MVYNMNPQRGKHMEMGAGGGEDEHDEHEESNEDPQIHIHSHAKGHTVHIMHKSGKHEQHEHSKGDTEGIAEHIHKNLGAGGQDHGYSGGDEEENEMGAGPGV